MAIVHLYLCRCQQTSLHGRTGGSFPDPCIVIAGTLRWPRGRQRIGRSWRMLSTSRRIACRRIWPGGPRTWLLRSGGRRQAACATRIALLRPHLSGAAVQARVQCFDELTIKREMAGQRAQGRLDLNRMPRDTRPARPLISEDFLAGRGPARTTPDVAAWQGGWRGSARPVMTADRFGPMRGPAGIRSCGWW